MSYILVDENNVVIKYPLTIEDIRKQFPNVSFPNDIDLVDKSFLNENYIYYIEGETLIDEHEFTNFYLIEDNPVLIDGVWHRKLKAMEKDANYLLGEFENTKKKFTNAIQKRLDKFAQERNYDNIFTACSYANSTEPTFKQEADRCILLRDLTWKKGYELLNEVKQGIREIPATLDDVVDEFPALTWE